jgi:ribosomal protein S18 acetylase RimI-like enzyme
MNQNFPASPHPLDNPAYESLTGAHAGLAERQGQARRYPAEVTMFSAVPLAAEAGDWAALAGLAGPGAIVVLAAADLELPPDWELMTRIDVVQFTGEDVAAAADDEAVTLGESDVPEILELIERTKPGPFAAKTIELGRYLGIRRGGRLVAMAGERLRPPGWTELSAICTDEEFRGQGLATGLVHALSVGIRARGETPFLHVAAENTAAIRLYEALAFRRRREVPFVVAWTPGPRGQGFLVA